MGLLNARLVPLEELCQEPVLCCSCPLDSRRSSDEPFYGLQEAVRLGLGSKQSTPPDDDWWAHQILIRPPEKRWATFYSKHSSRCAIRKGKFWQLIETE